MTDVELYLADLSWPSAPGNDLAHPAILDAMGHGLEASRMANLAVGAYRHSTRRGEPMEEVFGSIDGIVESVFGCERFVTGQLACLDMSSGRMRWSTRVTPSRSSCATPSCRA